MLTRSEIRDVAFFECLEVGYKLLNMKDTNEDYLKVVLAFSKSKQEYVTWVLNLSLGGVHLGHYYTTLEEAEKDFERRD